MIIKLKFSKKRLDMRTFSLSHDMRGESERQFPSHTLAIKTRKTRRGHKSAAEAG